MYTFFRNQPDQEDSNPREDQERIPFNPTYQPEEIVYNCKAVPPLMTKPLDGAVRDTSKAAAEKIYLIWAFGRHLSSLTSQKLPAINGFISVTGKLEV